ncbi:hypothetical protein [Burkholderia pyrrocinia]|uniref:hypothetical protein n=1 Tax=Burkholderia pyrrocinia TaxID=60550 RepID=UPI001BD0811F|nr:hypothetical protein [Burkholderia pyrrocinia]QVN16652.1 hypothetical protein JYG32_10100 [Burkholderia pyrrocinia]
MTLLAVEQERSLRALCEAALPRWVVQGYDASLSLCHERLEFSGRPQGELSRRLMVQCRQRYVLSHVSLQGWFDGGSVIERTWSGIQRRFYHSRLPFGWAFSISTPRRAVAPDCSGVATAWSASVAQVK